MFRSARPFALEAGADGPLVCYQGAWVADARPGDWSSATCRSRSTSRARRSQAIQRAGYGVNCYVDDELYVAEVTPEAQFYADYQGMPVAIHAVGDLLDWLDRPPTKLVVVGVAGAARPARGVAARAASPPASTSSARCRSSSRSPPRA